MAERTTGSAPGAQSLPDKPDLDWLRKQARRLLGELRKSDPDATLATAQFELAKSHGFPSWRALKAHIDALSVEGQLFAAARAGDAAALATLLEAHPDALHAREKPYEASLLHAAAHAGQLAVVDLLLARGLDPNIREKGDDTTPMHWAAAAAHLDVVQRLADAGGDVIGQGDDHGLAVIGWATCWDGCDDPPHRAVVDFLISRGARHHIFSAIALGLGDEVRRIVAADPSMLNSRMSRNENNQLPLHFAVQKNRPEMVALLLELGADPLAVDHDGQPVATYAGSPGADRPVMEAIHAMTMAELRSAERGLRPSRGAPVDLLACISLRDWDTAARLVRENPELLASGGALHLLAKRGDAAGVRWLLDRGANPNARWPHWDAEVTPLHMVAFSGSVEVAELLLAAGADPTIPDSKHDGDARGWAEHLGRMEIIRLLDERGGTS